jgi:hypothetical protein
MKLICAIPYPNQIREMRNEREYNLYNRLIEAAETVAVCSECYFDGCYRIRNLFMVNYSSAVIGYMKSRKLRSGTMQTVNMAERAGLEMHIMYGSENPQFTMADLW